MNIDVRSAEIRQQTVAGWEKVDSCFLYWYHIVIVTSMFKAVLMAEYGIERIELP